MHYSENSVRSVLLMCTLSSFIQLLFYTDERPIYGSPSWKTHIWKSITKDPYTEVHHERPIYGSPSWKTHIWKSITKDPYTEVHHERPIYGSPSWKTHIRKEVHILAEIFWQMNIEINNKYSSKM